MLLTIEKVAVLKTIDIFADTPDYVLASVARITEELNLLPGERFINEGDLGDSMYLVVEGNVRVHRDDRTIITLGPGKAVGELAVLDPEPRSASGTAIDDAFVFRIAKDAFDEAMADQIAITVVATGFANKPIVLSSGVDKGRVHQTMRDAQNATVIDYSRPAFMRKKEQKEEKEVIKLGMVVDESVLDQELYNVPTFLRKKAD